jgi:hypothetical protein
MPAIMQKSVVKIAVRVPHVKAAQPKPTQTAATDKQASRGFFDYLRIALSASAV